MKLSEARAPAMPIFVYPISLDRHLKILRQLTRVEKRVWWQWFPGLNAEHIKQLKEIHGRLGLIQGGRQGWPANHSGYLNDVLPKDKKTAPWRCNGPNSPMGGDAA